MVHDSTNFLRLDCALGKRGLAHSRTHAQALLKSGAVLVNERPSSKASLRISESDRIELRSKGPLYVSRAAHKLLAAFERSPLLQMLHDFVGLDIGASSGGFTEVLLEKGAKEVIAVDIGKDQLHPSLRKDKRVRSLENQDARLLSLKELPQLIDLITIDVSFTSVLKVLRRKPCDSSLNFDVMPEFWELGQRALWVILIKPQFELENPEQARKSRYVLDPVHSSELSSSVAKKIEQLGLQLLDFFPSPLLGKEGNQEFLGVFQGPLWKGEIGDQRAKDL